MPRAARLSAIVFAALLVLSPALAAAQTGFEGPAAPPGGRLMPPGFFDNIPKTNSPTSSIEADSLAYNSRTDIVTARGRVILRANGYTVMGEQVTYNRRTGAVRFQGAVEITDPQGTLYRGRDLEVTGGLRQGFIDALTITLPQGGRVTADSARYTRAYQTVLENGAYSPCGDCIDSKGRRIGWRVRANRMIYDDTEKVVSLDQPVLELLGVPVAWLPWLSMPDPTQKRKQGFAFPVVDYSDKIGVKVGIPYFWAPDGDSEVIFTPALVSRQGVQLQGEYLRHFARGDVDVKVSGIYQLTPSAFAGKPGDRRWRGAIQTSGQFVPAKDWTAGWSFMAFTDPAYPVDYHLVAGNNLVNEAYATNLTPDFYGDFRVQRFHYLSDSATDADQNRQALTVPNARVEKIIDLGPDKGRIELDGRMLGLIRTEPQFKIPSTGAPVYVTGFAEDKVHATFQAGWRKQWILPPGLVATPYLGLRGDVAYAASSGAPSPGTPPAAVLGGPTTLLSATPIAAMDIRFPMVAHAGSISQLIEPIAQLVWRGSDTSLVGITNDDAQSFVFDDTNLFSFNRFSGADRQETGLRANIGGRYQADFGNGRWLDVTAGESFQLAGANAFAAPDPAGSGLGSGLTGKASYVVAGVTGSPLAGLSLGAKTQLDPATGRFARVAASADWAIDGFNFGARYYFRRADPTRGMPHDQEEAAGVIGIPLADYVTLTGGAAWDLTANQWLEADAGIRYDDGYLVLGAQFTATGPTHTSPNDRRFLATFLLKTPDGGSVGF